MGTRNFYATEQKNSRIKWEQADTSTAQKLARAINKNSHGAPAGIARIVVFLPAVIPLVLLVGALYLFIGNFLRGISIFEIIFYLFFFAGIVFFSILLFIRYKRFKPYLYPERQPHIWTFRAKCTDAYESGLTSEQIYYYACFQKGGVHIQIRILYREYIENPVGKEYIFYKFNNCTGNRWAAIAADKLDEAYPNRRDYTT